MGKKLGPSAIDRARVAWADMARETRFDLRQIGVRGDLPKLTLMACGARGAATSTGLTRFAMEMRDRGLSKEAASARLTNVAGQIVALVYHDGAA